MKKLQQTAKLFTGTLLAVVLLSLFSHVVFAGSVGHKFQMELPDGSTHDIPGAIVHTAYIDETNNDTTLRKYVNDTCDYNGDRKTGGSQCTTSSSCDLATWHAPMLPTSFADDYKAKTGLNFSDLISKFTLTYEPNRIRGFDGAYWEGSVASVDNGTADGFKIVSYSNPLDEPTIANYSQGRKDDIRSLWKQKAGASNDWNVSGTTNKEILFDNVGGNSLHGNVVWTLKTRGTIKNVPTPQGQVEMSSANCPANPGKYPAGAAISLKGIAGGATTSSSEILLAKTDASGTALVDWTAADGCPGTVAATNSKFCRVQTATGVNAINSSWTPSESQTGKYFLVINAYDTTNTLSCSGNPICPYNPATSSSPNSLTPGTCSSSFVSCSDKDFIEFEVVASSSCTTTTVTPAPVAAPMCMDVHLAKFGSDVSLTDLNSLKVGDKIKIQCGSQPDLSHGTNQFYYKITPLDASGNTFNPIFLKHYTDADSFPYDIKYAGSFIAQCTICPSGQGSTAAYPDSCYPFEPINRSKSTLPEPTPEPVAVVIPECPERTIDQHAYSCMDATTCDLFGNAAHGSTVDTSYSCSDTSKVCCKLGS